MTDVIPTVPISTRRFGLPRRSFSKIGIGAWLNAIARLLGHAFNLAYVAPYTSVQLPSRVLPENDLEGRDADW